MKARLFSSYVHEFTHMLIRKIKSDLNISTPPLSNNTILELGFAAERECYGVAVDWSMILMLPGMEELMEKFINSIEKDCIDQIYQFQDIPDEYTRNGSLMCFEYKNSNTFYHEF